MGTIFSNLVFVLLLTGLFPALDGDSPPDPQWPLDLDTRYLTSNFMEFRSGRFHAGLDLKTETRQGYTVRAVEDGYISRLRCTPTAYGRVVYLRGESGRTYVFAHLSRFNDELRARVQQVQKHNDTYRARLEFKPNQILVKKGDVLGLSGQSGTGGPHLHFEVRDRNQRPINPLQHGFDLPDTIAPVIHSLRAWPTSATARINDQTGEWAIKGTSSSGLVGDLGILKVIGPVAFSARMIDASDIRGHHLEPWLIELELDGEVVYSCRNDRYDFSENAMQRLEWTDWADWTEEGVPREHWLHRRPANTLAGREGKLWYLGAEGSGLEPGDHHLVLRVTDYSLGETLVHWVVQVVESSAQGTKSGFWHSEPLGINKTNFPQMKKSAADSLRLTPFFSSGDPVGNGLEVVLLHPDAGDPVLEPLEIWLKKLYLTPFQKEIAQDQGLKFGGWAEVIFAADWPIESSVVLPVELGGLPLPYSAIDASEGTGVYRLNNNGAWEFVAPCSLSRSKFFHFEDPGLHAVFVDETPPVFQSTTKILDVLPGPNSALSEITMPKWVLTAISLDDPGSGLDTGTLKALLDGKPLIVEPDPPRDRVLIEWPDDLAPGEHELQLQASDVAGNHSEAKYSILVGE